MRRRRGTEQVGTVSDEAATPAAPAAPADVHTDVHSSVNLLSPWVHEDLRARRWRGRFALAAVALVVAMGAGWTFQQLSLSRAEADLRGEEAVTTSLQERIGELAGVRAYVDGVTRRGLTVQQEMLTEVAFSDVLAALEEATPGSATIETTGVSLPAAGDAAPDDALRGLAASPCPGPDPFGALEVVGCLTFTGRAPDRATVASLVERLDAEKAFDEPFVTTTTVSDTELVFTGSVALTTKVFTGRFDDLADVTGVRDETGETDGETDGTDGDSTRAAGPTTTEEDR